MAAAVVRARSAQVVLPDGESSTISLATCCGGTDIPLADLGPQEARRAHEIRNPDALHAYLRGRLAAKAALSELRGGLGGPFEIANGLFGCPLVQVPNADLGVSISHHGDAAAAVAAPVGWPFGIDLTVIDSNNIKAIRSQVGPEEERTLHGLGLAPEAAATTLWSAKEALSKVLGGGLGIDFKILAIRDVLKRCLVLRLRFEHVGHIEVDALVGARSVIALAMPYHVQLNWVTVQSLFTAIVETL